MKLRVALLILWNIPSALAGG